jgi:hypothetical protein
VDLTLVIVLGLLTMFGLWWTISLFVKDQRRIGPIEGSDFELFGAYLVIYLGSPITVFIPSWRSALPFRVAVSGFSGAVLILATLSVIAFASSDPNSPYTTEQLSDAFPKVLLLVVFLCFKTAIGPLISIWIVGWAIYTKIIYGMSEYIPVLASVVDYVFYGIPEPAGNVYVLISTIYLFVTSLYDTLNP